MKNALCACSFLLLFALTDAAYAEPERMVNKDGKIIEDVYVALKQNDNLSGKILSIDARVIHVKNPVLVRVSNRSFLTGDFFRYWDRSGVGEVKEISRVWIDFFEINVFTENEIDLETGLPPVAEQSDSPAPVEPR